MFGLMSVRQTCPVPHPPKQESSKSQARDFCASHSEECRSQKIALDVYGWEGGGDTALIKSSLRNGATFSPRPERAKPDLAFSSH